MKLSLFSAAMVIIASTAMAQHAHQSGSSPSETGQSQFAAIAEIVTLLREDDDTDWAQVDIQALRDHLVDMDNVTTGALVETTVDEMTISFSVTGDENVSASIRRMVLAHSPMLQQATGWAVTATEQADGAIMMIEVVSEEDMQQVAGLGFFGLMTIGAHHQQHHLMIAMGRSPH
mgnify:CR=1 FL=1